MTKTLLPAPAHILGPTWRKYDDGSWFTPEHSLGWAIINWMCRVDRSTGEPIGIRQPGGPDAGSVFIPTFEQARFIVWWYAVDENGRFIYRSGLLRRLKGWGKDPLAGAMAIAELCGPVVFSHFNPLTGKPEGKPRPSAWIQIAAVNQDQPLALGTEVPTPNGWTTVGDLHVGDFVYGSDGQPHMVQRQTEVLTELDCYRVTFDDGTEVVASASHGWTTERLTGHGDRYEVVTTSTKELVESVRGSKNRKRHRIPVVGFDSADRNLLVDPWFLGLWLGDGSTADSSIVFDWRLKDEYEVLIKPLVREFQTVVWTKLADNWGTLRIKNNDRTRDSESTRAELRHVGVLGHKHIPEDYLLAGTEQRRELIRGLMDSDGGIDVNGRAYFVNANQHLVYQFQELAVGLGFRCTVRNHGKDGALRAEFNPGNEFHVSKLAYKYERQAKDGSRTRSRHRWIESAEPIPSVPVKCIGIDTADNLFQVTRSRVLTHNTRNTFTLFPALISDPLKAEFGIELNKTIIYTKAGGMIEGVTSSPLALEGKRPTFIIQNETQWWVEANDGHRMAEVIAGNVDKAAYGGCRALSICNGHIPGEDSQAERDYDAHMNVLSGKDIDTGLLYDSIEAPAGTPVSEIPSKIDDPEGHAAGIEKLRAGLMVARGDAKWLDLDTIILSMLDRRRPVTESRRKFLNQINAHEDSWIATWEWNRCTPDTSKGEDPLRPLSKGDRITLGFDGSKSNDHTALVACRVEDAALFLIKSWDPEKYPNGVVPREQVNEQVEHSFSRYDVVAFRADVKEFESYVDQWGTKYKKQIKVNASPGHPVAYDMRGQQKRFALDCERFLDAVLEQELCHDSNQIMRQHVLNARRHPTTFDAISIRKASKDSSRKIDVAVCAVLAYGARQEFLMSKRNRSSKAVVIR